MSTNLQEYDLIKLCRVAAFALIENIEIFISSLSEDGSIAITDTIKNDIDQVSQLIINMKSNIADQLIIENNSIDATQTENSGKNIEKLMVQLIKESKEIKILVDKIEGKIKEQSTKTSESDEIVQ